MLTQPLRVLHVIAGMGSGGAEALLMNVYRKIDRAKVQFDFLLRTEENIYAEEIRALGGTILQSAAFPRHALKNYRDVRRHLARREHGILHVHGNALLYTNALWAAKREGVPVRIMHSHNTNVARGVYLPLHLANRLLINRMATHVFACSAEAGKWMFPRRDFKVVRNGIDIDRFTYSESARIATRADLGISGTTFLVGHVGRFLRSKNHSYVARVFAETKRLRPDSHLVLVGSGPEEDSIVSLINNLGLGSSVTIAGLRGDVPDLMSAFDAFLFPSRFEGLAVVLVEAQAAGLPCLISDSITPEVHLTDLVKARSISEHPSAWAEQLVSMSTDRSRLMRLELDRLGYGASSAAAELERFYLAASCGIGV